MTGNVLTAVVVLMTGAVLAAPVRRPSRRQWGRKPKRSWPRLQFPRACALFSVCPRPARPSFVTDLAAGSEFLVYFQSPNGAEELAVRKAAQAAGLLGKRVFADRGSWRQIHLADNLAGLIWLSPAAQQQVPPEEVLRVLHPEGKALYGQKEVVKPLPAGADAWSHPYHGPDNNPQSQDQVARVPWPDAVPGRADVLAHARGYGRGRRQGLQGLRFARHAREPERRAEHAHGHQRLQRRDPLETAAARGLHARPQHDDRHRRYPLPGRRRVLQADRRVHRENQRRDRRSRGRRRRQSVEMDGLGHRPARPGYALRPGGRRRSQAEDRGLRKCFPGVMGVSRRDRLGLQTREDQFRLRANHRGHRSAHQEDPLET